MASLTDATTLTTANDLTFADWVDSQVIDAAYSNTVMRGLVYEISLAGRPTNSAVFPSWPALTAAAVAETADLANTAISTGGVTISVGEVGILATLTDSLVEDDIFAGVEAYARQCGKAVADKMDADIAALLGGFSNTTGSDADGLTYADHLAARRALDTRDAPGPLAAVYHPVQLAQLHADVAASTGAAWGAGNLTADERFTAMKNGEGTLAGVFVFQSTNVPTGGTTGYYGGMFSVGRALGFASKREARTEYERDISARATETVVTARYGTGELVDAFGQTVISDTTA